MKQPVAVDGVGAIAGVAAREVMRRLCALLFAVVPSSKPAFVRLDGHRAYMAAVSAPAGATWGNVGRFPGALGGRRTR